MNRTLKLLLAVVLTAGVIGLLIFAFIEGRAEIAREREREQPIKVPPRISRTQSGDLIVTIDHETQTRIGLKTAAVTKQTVYPEIAAYGRLLEDPSASFVVRAPVAGVLRRGPREWPGLGEVLADGQTLGNIEPRLVPFERVDLDARLTNAKGDVAALEAALSASKATYDRTKALNADDKNMSDRAVQEAEARVKADEARLNAARKNVAEFEAAAKTEAGQTGPMPLVTRAGEVVEVTARPNEAVESGQAILRVARFDTMLARVDLPAGEVAGSKVSSARIAAVGREEQQVRGERVALASIADPRTLGEGYLFRVGGLGGMLRPGAAITAYLQVDGKPTTSFLIPQSAIVRSGGKTWIYRQVADDKYSRQEVALSSSSNRGWLVTGVTERDRVVSVGAQLLLSEEQKSQIQILEEAESK